jgi:hypothetical protein
MKALSDYIGEELILVQPKRLKRNFELTSSTEVIQRMTFSGIFRTNALITDSNCSWEIKSASWWSHNLEVFKESYQMPLTLYTSNIFRTKGFLNLDHGEKLVFKFNWFKKSFFVFNSKDELLLVYSRKWYFLKSVFSATIKQKSILLDENPYLIMLGFYIFIENTTRRSAL